MTAAETLTDLKRLEQASRCASARRFDWRRGMWASHGSSAYVVLWKKDGCWEAMNTTHCQVEPLPPDALPSLDDPGTQAHVLRLIQDAWGQPDAWLNREWAPVVSLSLEHAASDGHTIRHTFRGEDVQEVLVKALEEAP